MDSDQSGELDASEFWKALVDYKVGCTEVEAEAVFHIFDRNHNGTIDFEEFMDAILGQMNDYRLNLIR